MQLPDRIKQEINILELTEHYGISVKNNKALCPFHQDKNASLTFYPKNNRFYCFGCGVRGTVIDLVMKIENKTFNEAIKYLSEHYHIAGNHQDKTEIKTLRKQNMKTTKEITTQDQKEIYQYFYDILILTDKGKEYLNRRGLSDNTLNKFRVKSIDDPNKIFNRLKKKFSINDLKQAGLIGTSKKERDYLIFYKPAIMFTHFENSEPIYFSSRNLTGDPKSFKLHKVKQKYFTGFDKAKEIYIFESIIDGLSNYELYGDGFISINGVNSINAEKYQTLLKQYPEKKFIIAFDNDPAGIKKQDKLKKEIKKFSNFSFLNWETVFIECQVKNCQDMNDVLMEFKQNNANTPTQSNEKEVSSIKLLLDKLTPEQKEDFEERAAIMEYDGNLTREQAEQEALQTSNEMKNNGWKKLQKNGIYKKV